MYRALLTLILFFPFYCLTQNINPDFNEAFLQDEVAIVHIEISEENLGFILDENNWANEEVPATFIYNSSSFSDTINNIGFRLRGNTSLQAAKKSFKVSFNSFNSGFTWNSLKKLNLNGEHNDVSIMRSKLGWDLLRELNLPASRTSYVRLYINDEYKGVYLNVEHIDDLFIDKRFSEGNGNLYKCTYPAHLQYEGASPSNYQTSAYELKTNEWNEETYSDLAAFISQINLSSSSDLNCEIQQYFNLKNYIKSYAAEVLLGHWDGYSVNQNNFYLYSNLASGRINWIHYDLDNTLGIDWLGQNWSEKNIYSWYSEWDDRPLVNLILENDEWRNLYSNEIQSIISSSFNVEAFTEKIQVWKNLISPYVLEDNYYSQDYGFSYNDFLIADSENWGNHVTQGILEYVETRTNFATQQLEELEEPNGVFQLIDSSPVLDENVFTIQVDADLAEQTNLTLYFQMNGMEWQSAPMSIVSPGFYEVEIPISDTDLEINYYVQHENGNNSLSYPCEPLRKALKMGSSSLLINELMADNEAFIADENGGFEDWVELYNSNTNLGLGQYYLSDDKAFPNKWRLPDDLILPNSHELIWCDDDPEEGSFHANFKLQNEGESVYLSSTYGDGFQVVDFITFGSLDEDTSLGRSSDGHESWVSFTTPTPNAPNVSIVSIKEIKNEYVEPFPNPTRDLIHLKSAEKWTLLDSRGKILNTGFSNRINLSNFSSGTYMIQVSQFTFRIVKI